MIFLANRLATTEENTEETKSNTMNSRNTKTAYVIPKVHEKYNLNKMLKTKLTAKPKNTTVRTTLCLKKNVLTLKRYSSKLQGAILMKFGRNIQNTVE